MHKIHKILKAGYLIGCFVLVMIAFFSMAYAQGTCPTPGTPSNPSPSDAATNIFVNPILSWSASSSTDSYNVYFGTSSNPPYSGNTTNINYSLYNLASNTTYFWRISALNNCGNATVGPVWSFVTGCQSPEEPFNPSPKDDGIVVGDTTTLSWNSSYSDSFDVYFGTSFDPPFLGNTTNASYNIDNLSPQTNYSWKVVAKNNCGYSIPGAVWSFATAPTNPYSSSNWTNIEPPNVSTSWFLNSVHFTSSNEGWAVGVDNQNNRGVLLHNLSGTWTSVNPPDFSPSWELNGVYFTSSDEGWAVGTEHITPIDRGVLLHYLNGIWTAVTPPYVSSNWSLYSVHFTSSNEGWAVGKDYETGYPKAVLLHYLNGSWTSINPPDGAYVLYSVYFVSPDEGWAVGYGQVTHDQTVMRESNLFLHYLNGSWKADNTWLGDASINLLDAASPPIPLAQYQESVTSVYFISPNEGWAVGEYSGTFNPGQGELFHYLSGFWEPSSSGYGNLNGAHFISLDEGWAVGLVKGGPASALEKIGLLQYWYGSWEPVSPPNVSSSWELNGVYFTFSDEGWAVGTDGANKKGVLLRFFGETISTPTTPDGPTSGLLGKSYSYSTGGSTSNLGNPAEYQLDWKGDGSDVFPWGSAAQSKACVIYLT